MTFTPDGSYRLAARRYRSTYASAGIAAP